MIDVPRFWPTATLAIALLLVALAASSAFGAAAVPARGQGLWDWIPSGIQDTHFLGGLLLGLVVGYLAHSAWSCCSLLLFYATYYGKRAVGYGALIAMLGSIVYFV